jgi:acyl-CoA-binding protein
MSYAILKNLGLDHLDADSPDFLKALDRMQKDAWHSLQGSANDGGNGHDVDEAAIDRFLADWA